AHAVLGESAKKQEIDRIAEHSGGLPLFAEELARLTAGGRDPLEAPTIQAAIQVSLDALDEECRDAVGRLSVLRLACWDSGLRSTRLNSSHVKISYAVFCLKKKK